jgi:hypothetical protein
MQILKRLDKTESHCTVDHNCPAVFSTTEDSVVFIGRVVSSELRYSLPGNASIGPGEELVEVPCSVLRSAGLAR